MAKTFRINGKTYIDQLKQFQEGSFGQIFLVKDETNKKYILKKAKILNNREDTEQNFKDTEKEFDVLKKIESCPNIIKADGFLREDDDVLFLIEYGEGGDLLDFINKHLIDNTKITGDAFISITQKLIGALTCFHKLGIYNLDIKPENIIFKDKKQTEPAIIDFGLAVDNSKTGERKCSFYGGTRLYNAPEISLGKPYDCSKADIYSMGKTLSVLYTITRFNNQRQKVEYLLLITRMMIEEINSRWNIDEINKYIEELNGYVLDFGFKKSKTTKSKSKKSKTKKSKSTKSKSTKSKTKKSKTKKSKSTKSKSTKSKSTKSKSHK
jgi:serine/threonine protein kinase